MLKKLSAPTDLTVGTPWKCILTFTLPMIIGNIAQQLYSTVDSIVVGKYIGDNALAAVGSAMPILNMLLVLFIGISAGASIMVSQYFGAKDRDSLSHTVGNCITATIIACVALIAVTLPVIRPLLKILNTPESILEWCVDYLSISIIGVAGMAYYNILSGILRGMGDSYSALIYLLIATVLIFVAYPLFKKAEKSPKVMYSILFFFLATIIAYTCFVIFNSANLSGTTVEEAENYASALKNGFTLLGCGVGILVVYAVDLKWIKFETKAVWWAQVLKVVGGLALVLITKELLRSPLELLFNSHLIARSIRYFIIVLVGGTLWPMTFRFFAKLGKK